MINRAEQIPAGRSDAQYLGEPNAASPSPLNGERAGVRGETAKKALIPDWHLKEHRPHLTLPSPLPPGAEREHPRPFFVVSTFLAISHLFVRVRSVVARRWRRLIGGVGLAFLALAFGAWLALRWVPLPAGLFEPAPPGFEITDRHGQPLRLVRRDDGQFERRVAFPQIPPALIQATLAAEDQRFWQHPGVDLRANLRAGWSLVRHRRIISGASTITQQLIKQTEHRPRTWRTKIIEAAQALRLEQIWDKQRILAEYLNRVDYGNLNSGCAQAARFYFDKPLAELSAAECALLAGLPQAPTRLNPLRHFERAQKRQQWILRRMHECGFLTEAEFARATVEPLRLARAGRSFEAPHFVDWLLAEFEENSPGQGSCFDVQHFAQIAAISQRTSSPALSGTLSSTQSGGEGWGENSPKLVSRFEPLNRAGAPASSPAFGLPRSKAGEDADAPVNGEEARRFTESFSRTSQRIPPRLRTSLDLELNHFVAGALRAQLSALQSRQARDGAVVVIDNRTGELLALVGSGDYRDARDGQVNGAWARRSPGSALKPFTYLLAFERGTTSSTLLADVPSIFPTPTGEFAPVNFDRTFRGPVRARSALATSLNIPAVRILDGLGGPAPLQQRLRACGLATLDRPPEHYGLGLTLGNAEVRLLELANAYACLARLGEYRPLRVFPDQPVPAARRVFEPRAAWLLADVLSDNDARAPAFGLDSSLRFDFRVACKTGTSSDFRDNWAFGYTPEFTVGVWVGNFDGAPMQRVSGVSGAAPLLHAIFERLHERFGTSWYERPPGVVEALVDARTGRRVSSAAPGTMAEKFLAETLVPEAAPDDFDARGRMRLGAEYHEWWREGGVAEAGRFAMRDDAETGPPRILSPTPGATFFLDPDLPQHGRRLRLRALGGGVLRWESHSLTVRGQGAESEAELTEGRHKLVLRDATSGRTAESWIEVRRF